LFSFFLKNSSDGNNNYNKVNSIRFHPTEALVCTGKRKEEKEKRKEKKSKIQLN